MALDKIPRAINDYHLTEQRYTEKTEDKKFKSMEQKRNSTHEVILRRRFNSVDHITAN
jgi:hypothetical protein